MSLSSELVSQFVKLTNDDKKPSEERTVFGTTVEYNGSIYVKIDGSDLLTPVSTTASVKADERVTVLIKDHSATITGNMSSPAARNDDVKEMGSKISEFEIVIAYRVTTDDLNAINAFIDDLKAITAKFENMEVVDAEIESLRAQIADVNYLSAKDIESITANIETLRAKFGDFDDISTEDLEAANAEIDNLKAYVGDFTYLSADVLDAIKASIKELEAGKLSVKDAEITYANIDFSNIKMAAVEEIFTKSGIIKDLVVGDSSITGELVGVTIKGDLIEAGTLKADKLVVKGSDGIFYKLNVEAGGISAEEAPDDGLHGSVIVANSITAEKINVHDLVAFGATIGGFHIGDKAIYSGAKESISNTTQGIYLDSEGQFAVGDSNNFLKFFKDTDGTYKLAISASSMIFSSSNKSVEIAINEVQSAANAAQNAANAAQNTANTANTAAANAQKDIDNLSIASRNLLLNSSLKENLNDWTTSGKLVGDVKTVTGVDVISVNDVCTSEHELSISVESKNLIPYPYHQTTMTKNGITFTDNGDGSIHISGTATANATFYLWYYKKLNALKAGNTYIPSTSAKKTLLMCNYQNSDNTEKNFTTTAKGAQIYPNEAVKDAIYLLVQTGTTVDETVYPMLEEGDTATSYTPYIADLTSIKVTRTGKNLLPYPYYDLTSVKTITKNGITYTDNGDGSITAKGTATANASCTLCAELPVKAGTYFISATNDVADIRGYYTKTDGTIQYITKGKNTFPYDVSLRIYVVVLSGQTVDYTFSPQLELGSVATECEPYTRYIPQAVQALDGYGESINDSVCNYIDFGRKQFVKCVDKIVIDGVTNKATAVHQYSNGYYYATITLPKDSINGTTEVLKIAQFTEASSVNPGNAYITAAGKTLVLVNPDQSLTTAAMWNTWLGENPIDVVYALATPEVTDISNILSVSANADGTVAGITSISPNMTVFTDTSGVTISLAYQPDQGFVTKYGRKCFHINQIDFKKTKNLRQSIIDKLEANTKYTLSGWVLTENIVKGTTNFSAQFYFDGYYTPVGESTEKFYSYGSKAFPVNTSSGAWEYVKFTFSTDNKLNTARSYNMHVYTRDFIGDVYVYDLKLEKGDKAGEWTPAPEDNVTNDAFVETIHTYTEMLNDSNAIILSALSEYTKTSDYETLKKTVETELVTTAGLIEMGFTTKTEIAETYINNEGGIKSQFDTIYEWIKFDGGITLGNSESAITLSIRNDEIVFKKGEEELASWDGIDFYTNNIVVKLKETGADGSERAQFGNFAFVPRSDGSLMLLKVGD